MKGLPMTITPFPHTYSVSLVDDHLVAPQRAGVAVGAPPQFGGSELVWSPEELLAGSALACLKATFDAYAKREQLPVLKWVGRATATLEKTRAGPAFTSIRLDVELVVEAQNGPRARDLVQRAERHCLVSAAIKVPVSVVVHVDERHEASSHGAA